MKKKMKREHEEVGAGGGGFYPSAEFSGGGEGKGKMPPTTEKQQDGGGVDELLAALGYKVRSSDMADVAQKMEQLEMAMVGTSTAADTVHYNPSDLSAWIESMLSELNAPPPPPPVINNNNNFDLPLPSSSSSIFDSIDASESSSITTADDFPSPPAPKRKKISHLGDDDLKLPVPLKIRSATDPPSTSPAELPVVVVDSQEAGIRLVHVLMACAEAVQQENLAAADALVKQISGLAASQGGAMRKVAGYFAGALARRIYGIRPDPQLLDSSGAFSDLMEMHFYDTCPYIKFAHFTANQAILDASAGFRRLHVVDLGFRQGMQWPALMQALALRPGGPPSIRLTGIGPPEDGSDALQQVGWRLEQLAGAMGVEFEFRVLVAGSLADLTPLALRWPDAATTPEAVAVNSVFELHGLLARPGAAEEVLGTIRALRPRIVTVAEQEASHNSGTFMERFTEALHYYSAMFDSLEVGSSAAAAAEGEDDGREMSEMYLGRQICNVVACEGEERTERHETLARWRRRMIGAGFRQVSIGSSAFRQASVLLAISSGSDEYRVEEREGCLTLGWHNRPLVATSAWCVAGNNGGGGGSDR